MFFFFFSSRRRHTRYIGDWSSDVCSSDRIFHCHFSDNDGTTNVHWRPGQGKIDWEAVLVALKDTGYDGVISIELEDVPGVSRGTSPVPGIVKEKRSATEEFARENVLAMEYLRGICAQQNIPVR